MQGRSQNIVGLMAIINCIGLLLVQDRQQDIVAKLLTKIAWVDPIATKIVMLLMIDL